MKAWEIIGYAIDGEVYCVDCAVKSAEPCKCEKDENGLCRENCSGSGPNPIFASDENEDDCCECGEAL